MIIVLVISACTDTDSNKSIELTPDDHIIVLDEFGATDVSCTDLSLYSLWDQEGGNLINSDTVDDVFTDYANPEDIGWGAWEFMRKHDEGWEDYGCSIVTATAGYPVRTGNHALRFEIRDGDCTWWSEASVPDGFNDCENDRSRFELAERGGTRSGVSMWYGYSVYMATDVKVGTNNDTITFLGQFKSDLNYYSGEAFPNGFGYRIQDGKGGIPVQEEVIEQIGVWVDVAIYHEWSPTDDGVTDVYINGTKEGTYTGINSDGGENSFHFGIYNSFISQCNCVMPTQVVYFDNIVRGNSLAEVTPDGTDPTMDLLGLDKVDAVAFLEENNFEYRVCDFDENPEGCAMTTDYVEGRYTLMIQAGVIKFYNIEGFKIFGEMPQPVSPQLGEPAALYSSANPKICQPWKGVQNRSGSTVLENIARHDLYWDGPWSLGLSWEISADQPYQGLSTNLVDSDHDPTLTKARELKEELLRLNPNIKTLISVEYREGPIEINEDNLDWWEYGHYPPDSPLWFWDENGNPVPGWGEDADKDGVIEAEEALSGLTDFSQPQLIELIGQKALALKESGIVDGIFLDWWNERYMTAASYMDWSTFYMTQEEELESRLAILRRIRELVGDEFLILVNTNEWKAPLSAPYVNGIFMELYKPDYSQGYTVDHLIEVEDTLYWASENLQQPRINCLEGWRVVYDYGNEQAQIAERDSEENLRWMRVFTTIALTHSDGYVVFGDDNAEPTSDHYHNWYSFWDDDLGEPLSDKRQLLDGIEGVYIREFTNGYSVYNRSGKEQTVSLGSDHTAISTGLTSVTHTLANIDGEIYLRIDKG